MSHNPLTLLRRPLATLRRIADRVTAGPTRDRNRPIVADGGAARRAESDHLRELPDGAGCTEIWEHLSRQGDAED